MARKSFVVVENTRAPDQEELFRQIAAEGICPFCPEHLPRFFTRVIRNDKNWTVVLNNWPYEGSVLHLLVIHRNHAQRLADLSKEAWDELLDILQGIEKEFGLESGAFGSRFGNPSLNGGSVDHLHVHLIVADPKPSPGTRLRFAMGPKPKPL